MIIIQSFEVFFFVYRTSNSQLIEKPFEDSFSFIYVFLGNKYLPQYLKPRRIMSSFPSPWKSKLSLSIFLSFSRFTLIYYFPFPHFFFYKYFSLSLIVSLVHKYRSLFLPLSLNLPLILYILSVSSRI